MNKRIAKKVAKRLARGKLIWLPIDRFVDHPDNPRLFLREDIINHIKESLLATGQYSPKYALIVRPMPDNTAQILSGHHRKEGARRAGIKFLPAWSEPMSDEDAYNELVLANSQSELLPIEVAVHEFRLVDRGKGGRGEEGGISEYARKHNISKQRASELYRAGAVYVAVQPSGHPDSFKKKIQHLVVIYTKCPREDWAGLVQMIQQRPAMTVVDVEAEVAKILQQSFFSKNEVAQFKVPHESDEQVEDGTAEDETAEDTGERTGDGYVNYFLQITRAIMEARQHIVPEFTALRSTVSDCDLLQFDNAARAISSDCEDIFETINQAYASIERSENNETVAQIGSY